MDDKKKVTNEDAFIVDFDEFDEFDDVHDSKESKEEKVEEVEKTEEKKKEEKAKDEEKTEKEDEAEDEEKAEKDEAEDEEKAEKDDEAEDKEKAEKDEAENKKENDKSDEKTDSEQKASVSKKAISQGKRLADAKAAQKEVDSSADSKDKLIKEKEKKEKKPMNKKALWISLAAVVSVLLIVYIAGFVYFSEHFYKDVAINGVNVSGMDKATAQATLDNFYSDYMLTINTVDGRGILIKGSDIAMQIRLSEDLNQAIKKQQVPLWFINMFTHHDIEMAAVASWDDATLQKILNSLSIMDRKNMIEPQDAYVGVENGQLAIIKEVMGSTLIENKFKQVVNDSLAMVHSSVTLTEAQCYVLPKVYDTDEALQAEYNAKKDVIKGNIVLQLDDLTLDDSMSFYNAILEKQGDTYVVSEELVKQYVKELADKYDTYGKDRTFKTSFGGREVTIPAKKCSVYGYQINQEKTVKALMDALNSGANTTVEVVFDKKGFSLVTENEVGDSYIEVNLSEQKVYAYKNGELITQGDCVSGNESAGHGTCIGMYAIQNKLSPTVLRGEKVEVIKKVTEIVDGEEVEVEEKSMEYSYESPVTYWMQFNGGIGLHDAVQWRSSYGGNIYLYNGSHGCVNLPLDLASDLYKNFSVGDPVVVYFWDNENRK